MKKSNVVVTALIAVVSAFLLFLWVYMGFYRVDTPLDLILSIVWWVIVLAAVALIVTSEKTRRSRIRRIYVGVDALFNSEVGLVEYEGPDQLAIAMGGILDNLKYAFKKEDVPDASEFVAAYFVQTDVYKDRGDTWKGIVVVPAADASSGGEKRTFEDRESLFAELASLAPIAASRVAVSAPETMPYPQGA